MAEKIYGNSQVFCGGQFVSGPDGRSSAATTLMVVVPSLVWQFTVGPFFTERYSIIFSLFAAVLAITSVVLLLATAFADPGIMPRQKDYTEQYDPALGVSRTKQPPRYYDIILRGHPTKLKYCVTCNIYRPPRCTHCSVCENCVERFDHHCPWIGNCVGKRNYWLFYSFVSTTGALNAFSLATAAAHMAVVGQEIQEQDGSESSAAFVQTMKEEPLSTALTIYCTLLVWFTVGLCMYHSYLIATNQTTYEQIKGLYSVGSNPFHRGSVAGNCFDVLCLPVRPRYFDAATGSLRWPKVTLEALKEKVLTRPAPFPMAVKKTPCESSPAVVGTPQANCVPADSPTEEPQPSTASPTFAAPVASPASSRQPPNLAAPAQASPEDQAGEGRAKLKSQLAELHETPGKQAAQSTL